MWKKCPNITEPALIIRINQFYKKGMSSQELYDSTRGVWRVGARREKVNIVLSVYGGEVKEIYEVYSWHKAGDTPYNKNRDPKTIYIKNRWEFLGAEAKDYIRNKYIGKSVAHLFKKGAQNPIFYLNIKN